MVSKIRQSESTPPRKARRAASFLHGGHERRRCAAAKHCFLDGLLLARSFRLVGCGGFLRRYDLTKRLPAS
jgi:hypothetical protein